MSRNRQRTPVNTEAVMKEALGETEGETVVATGTSESTPVSEAPDVATILNEGVTADTVDTSSVEVEAPEKVNLGEENIQPAVASPSSVESVEKEDPPIVETPIVKENQPPHDLASPNNYNELLDLYGPNVAIVIKEIQDYAANMAPNKPQTDESIQRAISSFYSRINFIVNECEDKDFHTIWRLALVEFHKHRDGALAQDMILRGIERLNVGDEKREMFSRIINLMVSTADVATRNKAARLLDWRYVGEFGYDDDHFINRIRSFYNL